MIGLVIIIGLSNKISWASHDGPVTFPQIDSPNPYSAALIENLELVLECLY